MCECKPKKRQFVELCKRIFDVDEVVYVGPLQHDWSEHKEWFEVALCGGFMFEISCGPVTRCMHAELLAMLPKPWKRLPGEDKDEEGEDVPACAYWDTPDGKGQFICASCVKEERQE